jgi:excisionase family DNA binding protein
VIGYLRVDEACRLAGISRSTFYRLLEDPESGLAEVAIRIPGIRRIRIPSDRFVQWLEGGQSKDSKKHRGTAC